MPVTLSGVTAPNPRLFLSASIFKWCSLNPLLCWRDISRVKEITLSVAKYVFDFEKNIYFKCTDLFSTPEDQNGVKLV